MKKFEEQDGVAFILISFTKKNEFYYMRLQELLKFWNRAKEGGRKSFRYDELDHSYVFTQKAGLFVPYLDMIQKDLNDRD